MQKHVLVLTMSVAILACGAVVASAQQTPGTQTPTPQSPTTQPAQPSGPMTQQPTIRERLEQRLQDRTQREEEEDSERDGYGYGRGMMGWGYGPGWMHRQGWGGPRWMHWREDHQGCRRGGMGFGGIFGGGPIGRVLFSLMDADGDGKLSLQEFQAAQERIFKAMDPDKDGTVTLEEMQNFLRGTTRPVSQQ